MFPEFIEWFSEPFLTLRPYLGQPVRIEDYTEDGHYVVRAEIAGIDPENDLEVTAGVGYLTIGAQRSSTVEDKHRSEFRYGTFSRTIALPAGADGNNDVTADYAKGILGEGRPRRRGEGCREEDPGHCQSETREPAGSPSRGGPALRSPGSDRQQMTMEG